MKYLLFLLPFFSFGQEMPIAFYSGGEWNVIGDVKNQFQLALDSIEQGKYNAEKPVVTEDSLIQLIYEYTGVIYADYMSGRRSNDTIYTQPAMYNCSVTCKNYNECTAGGCYKTSSCGCACNGSGSCTQVNMAIFVDPPGKVVRERILISHGHYIPEN